LAAELRRGNRAALGQIYDRHAPVLLSLGFRILRDRVAAEEVLHDVFLELWSQAAKIDPQRETVQAWLAAGMRQRALNRRTSLLREHALSPDGTAGRPQ
jgi:RNA polymerase sigma-70 factor, ECF subfamily